MNPQDFENEVKARTAAVGLRLRHPDPAWRRCILDRAASAGQEWQRRQGARSARRLVTLLAASWGVILALYLTTPGGGVSHGARQQGGWAVKTQQVPLHHEPLTAWSGLVSISHRNDIESQP